MSGQGTPTLPAERCFGQTGASFYIPRGEARPGSPAIVFTSSPFTFGVQVGKGHRLIFDVTEQWLAPKGKGKGGNMTGMSVAADVGEGPLSPRSAGRAFAEAVRSASTIARAQRDDVGGTNDDDGAGEGPPNATDPWATTGPDDTAVGVGQAISHSPRRSSRYPNVRACEAFPVTRRSLPY